MAKKLAKKQDGGPHRMRPDSTKKGDSSKFDPSKVSKNGWIPSRNISPKVNIQSFKDKMIKKLGGSTKKK